MKVRPDRRAATDRVRQLRSCPWCPAKPGERCIDVGDVTLRETVHLGRMPVGITPEKWMALDDEAAAGHE